MKKFMIGVAAAAIAFSPLSVQVANANLESGPTYENLTEKASFYRVTRGFVSPLLELDNNVDTKIAFTKGRYLTYMDYIFVDDIYVNSITFTSNDSSQYQRVLLMENGMIRQQFDLSKYPDGVIPVNFDAQKVDTIKLQFNGVEGGNHTLAELEIVGNRATTAGAPKPSGDSTLVTPEVISGLLPVEEEKDPGTGSGGEPGVPVTPPVDEDDDSNTGGGTGTPTDPILPPVEEDDNGTPGTGGGEPTPVEPPVEDDNSGTPGTGTGTPTPPEEGGDNEDGIGGGDYVDNGETPEEETPEVPEDGEVVVPENPDAPIEGGDPVVPGEEEPVVVVPPTEEPVDSPEPPVVVEPEAPVEEEPEAPVVEEPVVVPPVVVPPVVEEEAVDICKAHPLTPSVFSTKQDYSVYSVNSASMKLLSHTHYNESYFLNKLKDSKIVMNGKVYSASEFLGFLKVSKYQTFKEDKASNVDCDVKKSDDVKPEPKKEDKSVSSSYAYQVPVKESDSKPSYAVELKNDNKSKGKK